MAGPLYIALVLLLPPAALASVSVCEHEDVKQAPWCNPQLDVHVRAEALVANLSVKEKLGLFLSGASAVPRIHWPSYNWWTEALHGVGRRGLATSWPQVIGVAASFNRSLWWQLGNLTSTEARGKVNGSGHTYWAPVINIFRDPRWGRGQESPGEDPHLTSEYALQFLGGMQGGDSAHLKVSACLKHFSAYSQETNRQSVGVNVTAQDMEDTYLPAFKAGVQQGNASCIMCSYNAETYGYGILGAGVQHGAIPSCANKFQMTDLARKQWGFNGYIVSDCYAVNRVHDQHHYASTIHDTINATLSAGMDLECGNTLSRQNMEDWYNAGEEAVKLADTALKRLFAVQLRLGWADPPGPWSNMGMEVVNTPAHQALAREAASQSMVLLKNDGGTLPLKSGVKKLAVLGPHANATIAMQGNYYGTAPFLISPCMGLAQYASVDCVVPPDCRVGKGSCWNESSQAAVEQADAAVLVVGLDLTQEDEGHDRQSLLLPGEQQQFVQSALEAAKGKPVVVVVMSGSAVDVGFLKDDARAQSLLWNGYPGQSGGQALAEALFGSTNSFGKLPVTWYNNSFTKAVGLQDYAMRPDPARNYPGRTHRFYTGTPLYPFGHGLSYTRFEVHLEVLSGKPGEASLARASVSNVGTRAGSEVLLLFGAPPRAGKNGRPSQELLAFSRVSLEAGASHVEEFELALERFQVAGEDGSKRLAAGTWRLWLGSGEVQALEVRGTQELVV